MKKYFLSLLFLLTTACQPGTMTPSSPTTTPSRITPTSRPATPTQTAIPSHTSTAPPPQRYFTEEFDGETTYWSILYASGDSAGTESFNQNGILNIRITNPYTWLYALYGAYDYEAVHLETRFENNASNVNALGLVCNYNEQDGWYEFNIASDGAYNLLYGQWLAEGIVRYTPILNDTTDRINKGNAVNEIGLDCYDNIVQLYINSKLIRKLNLSRFGLTRGKVGLSMASFGETPVHLAVYWVKVSPLKSTSP